MPPKLKAEPVSDSDSDLELESGDKDDRFNKKIKLLKGKPEVIQNQSKRFVGGLVISSESEAQNQLSSKSLSAAEKKGLKEVEELERELDLKNTFSKETNMRDENAEMNKYIEEQLRLRREATKNKPESKNQDDLFTMPAQSTDKIDDILLQSLSKHLATVPDEKSEAMLSSQMLNGIPEVDLGISEKIRAIEATEEAILKGSSTSRSSRYHSYKKAPFHRHRR